MRKLSWSNETLILIVSLWITLTCNLSFWRVVLRSDAAGDLSQPLFLLSVGVLTTGLVFFVLLLLAHGRLARPVLYAALVMSAATSYFMNSYGILFDTGMLENVVETNFSEASELLSPGLMGSIFLLGLLPAFAISRFVITRRRLKRGPIFTGTQTKVFAQFNPLATAFIQRLLTLVVAFGMIVTPLLVTQKEIFSLARNHQQVRHLIAPLNVLVASWRYTGNKLKAKPEFRLVGEDATLTLYRAGKVKPSVHVLIVGETARADNFSLGDYARETNPQLGQMPGLRFNEAGSCGTATAASLPCMFSLEGHDQYNASRSKNSDNFLDIAQRAGYRVIWLDNGNSCKGVCARIESRDVSSIANSDLCPDGTCFDEILVHELELLLTTITSDTLIVLHQLGSHGPAYYRRYPDQFRQFTPDCRSPNLGDCSDAEIVNAYDNTILYTDHVVASAINVLNAQSGRLDVSLIYVSDHGESLGEGGLYLHGMPYRLAPKEQTRVPFINWTPGPSRYAQRGQSGCRNYNEANPRSIAVSVSHDNLFHTELGLLGIQTAVYQSSLDVSGGCIQNSVRLSAR